jgi:hypothetical protein
LQPTGEEAEDFDPEPWHEMYFRAFDELRFDRFFGAFGGEGPISYVAKSRYAEDFGLMGVELRRFHMFMNVIDEEHLVLAQERDAAQREQK